MSPLWRDRLSIYVSPGALNAVRLQRGLHPSISAVSTIRYTSLAIGENLSPIEAGLKKMLTEQDGHADIVLVISNQFCRYALIPWSENLTDADEMLAFVRHHFSKVYGDLAQNWSLSLTDENQSESRMACAIDNALLDLLRGLCRTSQHRLRSIQPALMTAFNYGQPKISQLSGWLLMVEGLRVCVARIDNGRWCSVRASRMSGGQLNALPELLERELLQCAEENISRDIFVINPFSVVLPPLQNWTVHQINMPNMSAPILHGGERYALAVMGAR